MKVNRNRILLSYSYYRPLPRAPVPRPPTPQERFSDDDEFWNDNIYPEDYEAGYVGASCMVPLSASTWHLGLVSIEDAKANRKEDLFGSNQHMWTS